MLRKKMSRRVLLRNGAATWGALAVGAGLVEVHARRALAAEQKITFNRELRKKNESLDPEAVGRFVRAAHGDLKTVKEMLAEEPGFINATRDWGGGDFESGLGGASHMGNREMAEFLINNGARPNIFTFAMLGALQIVKAMLTAMPELLQTPGPHGITLMAHAKQGGARAESVVSYFESIGG